MLSPDLRAPILELAVVSTTDPAGDAVASQGNGLTGQTYQDIVGAAVDADQGTFTFSITVASSVPATPALPGGIKVQEWDWNLNAGPELPRGFPFAFGNAAPPEFIVMVLWDGVGFSGMLIDRRPLLTGGEAVTRRFRSKSPGRRSPPGWVRACWAIRRASPGWHGRMTGHTSGAAAFRHWIARRMRFRRCGRRVRIGRGERQHLRMEADVHENREPDGGARPG